LSIIVNQAYGVNLSSKVKKQKLRCLCFSAILGAANTLLISTFSRDLCTRDILFNNRVVNALFTVGTGVTRTTVKFKYEMRFEPT